MNQLELLILDSMRACDRKILDPVPNVIVNNNNANNNNAPVNQLKNLIVNFKTGFHNLTEQEKLNFASAVCNITLGQNIQIPNTNVMIDGSQLNRQDLLDIKFQLEDIYTGLTGIPPAETITSDDELRNINSFEYLRNVSAFIPESLRGDPGFFVVWQYCNPQKFYDPSLPYGNFYSEFLTELQKYIEIHEKTAQTSMLDSQRNIAEAKLSELDKMIDAIYLNPNYALERSYSIIRDGIQTIRQTDEAELESKVKEILSTGGKKPSIRSGGTNLTTPSKAGSSINRAKSNYGADFKPMITTSQPSEVRLRYKTLFNPIQLRFGTQGEIDNYVAQVNVIYNRWLQSSDRKFTGCDVIYLPYTPVSIADVPVFANAAFVRCDTKLFYINKTENIFEEIDISKEKLKQFDDIASDFSELGFVKSSDDKKLTMEQLMAITNLKIENHLHAQEASMQKRGPFTHVYFNNLSRVGGDHSKLDLERKSREKNMTIQLEGMEDIHGNVAVITLPADEGWMNHLLASDRTYPDTPNKDNVFKYILAIANGESWADYAKDFHISKPIKAYLYGDGFSYSKEQETEVLSQLLENSFQELGFDASSCLSPADKQAVYFHFIKYELTNYILAKLAPFTFNFSCKDAIDRGGVSSAYYNLMNSIAMKTPITQDEFERLLHGAPTLVKGRGMNKHTHLIWNTIDAYVAANRHKLDYNGNPVLPAWLPAWCDKHALPNSPQYCISELANYIETRSSEGAYTNLLSGILKPAMSKPVKVNAAKRLLTACEENKLIDSRLTHNKVIHISEIASEFQALHDKDLGKITTNMTQAGLLEVHQQKISPTLGKK